MTNLLPPSVSSILKSHTVSPTSIQVHKEGQFSRPIPFITNFSYNIAFSLSLCVQGVSGKNPALGRQVYHQFTHGCEGLRTSQLFFWFFCIDTCTYERHQNATSVQPPLSTKVCVQSQIPQSPSLSFYNQFLFYSPLTLNISLHLLQGCWQPSNPE